MESHNFTQLGEDQVQLRDLCKLIWKKLTDDQQLEFKSRKPEEKISLHQMLEQKKEDVLNDYEPQFVDGIPDNFRIVKLCPVKIDHLLTAPPQVVADNRRKPQNYESLTTPFKKNRRFLH